MPAKILKAVLRIDEQAKRFTPVAHNLSAQQAEAKITELKEQGIKTLVLPQASTHHGCRSVNDCKLCQNTAQNLSKNVPVDFAAEGSVEDLAAESE